MPPPEHGDLMDLSDDDSISLTSTVASEEQAEYAVEGIIAERKVDGDMKYLVRWEGYPDERCTWESKSSFQNEDTLLDWQTTKMRVARGLEKPCNIEALLDRVEGWISSTKERKSRRRAKRIRLGILVSPDAESDGEEDGDEDYKSSSDEREDFEPDESPVSRRTSKSTDSTIPISPEEIEMMSANAGGKAPTAVMFHPPKSFQASDHSSSNSMPKMLTDSPKKAVFDVTTRKPTGKGSTSSKNIPGEAKELTAVKGPGRLSLSEKVVSDQALRPKLSTSIPPRSGISRRVSFTRQDSTRLAPKSPIATSSTNKRPGPTPELTKKPRLSFSTAPTKPSARNSKNDVVQAGRNQMGSCGRGPARLGASVSMSKLASSKKRTVSGSAVLKNWSKNITRHKSKTFHPNASKTSDKPLEKFGKLSTMRRFEKRGKNEPAPNIESLTFLDLKHGTTIKPSPAFPNLTTTAKSPYEMIQQGLEQSPKEQIRNDSHVPDILNVVTEASDKDEIALNGHDFDLTEISESKTTSPVHMETISALSDEEKAKPSSDLKTKPSIPFQNYREQAALSSSFSPANDKFVNPQESPIEVLTTLSDSKPQNTASRANTAFGSYGNTSSWKAQLGNLNNAQAELVASFHPHDIMGTLMIGEERRILGDVRFRGLTKFANHLFLTMKIPPRQMHIWCQKICTVGEYQTKYHLGPSDYFGVGYSGFVAPFAQTAVLIAEMAEMLRLHASCAVFNHANFSLLIYPVDAGLESWNFLNHGHPNIPDGAALRFTLRKPLFQPDETDIDVMAQMESVSLREGESNISMLMRDLLGIEYKRLIQQINPELTATSNTFFLFFIGAEQEYRIMYKFLEAQGAKIFSWDTEGAWDYFIKEIEKKVIERGVILIEGSFWEIYLIPRLSYVLRKNFNVFNITFYKDPYAPHPHINRIFPSGHAILITDSFILLCPNEAARFFHWFRMSVLITKPAGTWKICTRPQIRDYLLCLVEARNVDEGHIFMKMYESIWYILPEEQMDDEEFETPIDEAPVRCMSEGVNKFDHNVGKNPNEPLDEDAIAKNDATHVEWFAGWALTELEKFRRFTVISGARSNRREAERKGWETKWSHIDILSPDTAFNTLKIYEWENKSKARKGHGDHAKQKSEQK